MGDIILMSPLICSLKKWKAELFLSILIEARFKALLEGNSLVNSIITDKTGSEGKSSLADLELIFGKLAHQSFDMVINLHGGTRSALQTLASHAAYRVGAEHYRYSFIYNIRIPHPQVVWQTKRALHTVENQLSLIKGLKIPIAESKLTVPSRSEVKEEVIRELSSLGIDAGRPYIIIHPGGSFPSKRWQPSKFSQLSDWLIKTYKQPVLIVADSKEGRIVREILSQTKNRVFSIIGPPLEKLIAIIEGCALYIGNDAGPTHLAAAFNKPIVVIFCSSNHLQWHPWKTTYSLIRKELPCSPCPGKKCHNAIPFECIGSIKLEEVQKGVEELMVKLKI